MKAVKGCTGFISCTFHAVVHFKLTNEPVYEISNNVVCATSKALDQPAHKRSLIRPLQVTGIFYECKATD